jgi:redox-sensitive bicupin YhaK (pirin superfamily)
MNAAESQRSRQLQQVLEGQATSDGAGVSLVRLFSPDRYALLDPFLLFDAFGSNDPDDYLAGFPDHPHRGFETVTYMLEGAMAHRDSAGNEGLLEAGSVQWMTAGRGIIHSEMPRQTEGRMAGFQLWVNLPAADKMGPPRYQDIPPDAVPEVMLDDGVTVKVLAGEVHGTRGPVRDVSTAPAYLDFSIPAGGEIFHPLAPDHHAFVHPYVGAIEVGPPDAPRALAQGQVGVLSAGVDERGVRLVAGESPVRVLLVAAQPIGEPVAHWGPFVMNTREEIDQAVADFQAGRLTDGTS